jgi:hypothetical protein
VGYTPSSQDPWDEPRKIRLPSGGAYPWRRFSAFASDFVYIAHFWPKSKPYRAAKQQFRCNKSAIFAEKVNTRVRPPFAAAYDGSNRPAIAYLVAFSTANRFPLRRKML